ncbi:MAG: T9SS type A sorting domain-containing protein [Saprospiraceae bacterium]|nr:T9SS type A sorting domain-containing protein [Saprospiraceae bacterium]
MKIPMLTIISFLLLPYIANSQIGYSISPESFNDSYDEDITNITYFRSEAYMENSSDSTFSINWEITNINIPIEWGLSVSDKYLSYPPGPEITTNNSFPLVFDPGEENIPFNIDVYPNQISGCGSFDVYITLDGSGLVLDTIEYKIAINDNDCLISTIDEHLFSKKIKLSPNPFVDYLNVSAETMIKKISLYSLQGSLLGIFTSNFYNLDLSNLEIGTYVVEIVNSEGHRAIKKIIKGK